MHASYIIVNIGIFGLCGALLWYIGFKRGSSKGDNTRVGEHQQRAVEHNRRVAESEQRTGELVRQQAADIGEAGQRVKRASELIQEAKDILGI